MSEEDQRRIKAYQQAYELGYRGMSQTAYQETETRAAFYGKEIAMLSKAGQLSNLPEGTVITTVKPTAEGYTVGYTVPDKRIQEGETRPAFFGKELARMAKEGNLSDLPKGAVITKVEPTPQGYNIQYIEPIPSWKETTITGKVYTGQSRGILGALFPKWFESPDIFQQVVQRGAIRAPFREFQAGVTGVFESWVRPEVPTPIGAVVGKAFGQTSAYETGEVSPFYAVGGLFGTYMESKGVAKGLEYAWKGVKAVTPEVVKQAAYATKESIRFSRVAKVLTEAKWAVQRNIPYWKLTAPFKKIIAPQEITELSLKQFGKVGLAEIEAVEASWLIRMAPKTGGVWISKAGEILASKEGFKVLSKLGGYWALREIMHTPYVSQTQVTRMGIQPYVPRTISTVTKVAGKTTTFIAPALISIPKVFQPTTPQRLKKETLVPMPKVWTPTYPRQRETFRPQTLLKTEPKTKQREELVLIPKITPIQIPRMKTLTVQTQTTKTVLAIPTPTMPKITIPQFAYPLRTGGGEGRSGGTKSLFGRWYRKEQIIKTPKQMLQTFFGTPRKPRRKRR